MCGKLEVHRPTGQALSFSPLSPPHPCLSARLPSPRCVALTFFKGGIVFVIFARDLPNPGILSHFHTQRIPGSWLGKGPGMQDEDTQAPFTERWLRSPAKHHLGAVLFDSAGRDFRAETGQRRSCNLSCSARRKRSRAARTPTFPSVKSSEAAGATVALCTEGKRPGVARARKMDGLRKGRKGICVVW